MRVYTERVKSISFRAEAELIEQARERAQREGTTLSAAFRDWLATRDQNPTNALARSGPGIIVN
jgi:hypothetical protein